VAPTALAVSRMNRRRETAALSAVWPRNNEEEIVWLAGLRVKRDAARPDGDWGFIMKATIFVQGRLSSFEWRKTHDRVGAERPRVREHIAEGVVARPLAQRRVKRNVATEQALNARADVANNRPRPHDDSAHDAGRFGDSIARQVKSPPGCPRPSGAPAGPVEVSLLIN